MIYETITAAGQWPIATKKQFITDVSHRSLTARDSDVVVWTGKIFTSQNSFSFYKMDIFERRRFLWIKSIDICNHFLQTKNSFIARNSWVFLVHFDKSFFFNFENFFNFPRNCWKVVIKLRYLPIHHGIKFGQTGYITVTTKLTITQAKMKTFVAKRSTMFEAI